MSLPSEGDWSFEEIRECDAARAALLEVPKEPSDHINSVNAALRTALRIQGTVLFARETQHNSHAARAVIQFLLPPHAFDHFFNGRSGYRAHFWSSPALGLWFNYTLLLSVRQTLAAHMPMVVRGIRLAPDWVDAGTVPVTKDFVLTSLDPKLAKCWICTAPLRNGGGELVWWRYPPTLRIPRWNESEGRHAPYRPVSKAFLDIKGGFVTVSRARQPKSPMKRAEQLHKTGWT
jgi:hypothetical protein